MNVIIIIPAYLNDHFHDNYASYVQQTPLTIIDATVGARSYGPHLIIALTHLSERVNYHLRAKYDVPNCPSFVVVEITGHFSLPKVGSFIVHYSCHYLLQ